MRILYSAIDQTVPGTKGGSVHVTAVAEGLAALGHEVHVLVGPGDASVSRRRRCTWIPMPPPLGAHQLRWARSGAVKRIAEQLRPDVIMERYYNFGGEAILHAQAAERARRAGGQRAGRRSSRLDEGGCSTARCSSGRCSDGASGSAPPPT